LPGEEKPEPVDGAEFYEKLKDDEEKGKSPEQKENV
jgi:hypothetical protein